MKRYIRSVVEDLSLGDIYSRMTLAGLTSSPRDFEQLVNDPSHDVRACLARNPNVPVNILEKLADDKESVVRGGVAANPNTPIRILDYLCLRWDNEGWIKSLAEENMKGQV